MRPPEPPVEAVVRDEEVEHGGDERLAFAKPQALRGDVAHEHARMVGAREVGVLEVAEVGKADRGDLVAVVEEGHAKGHLPPLRVPGLEVPLALLAPPEPDRPPGHHHPSGPVVDGERLPLGVVGLAALPFEVGGAEQAFRHEVSVPLDEAHQHRHVGVAAAVVGEVVHLPVDVELAQDDVSERHRESRVGALLHVEPHVGELARLGVVGADHHRLRPLVARLGEEVGVRGAGLRDVRAPQDEEARVVPVGRLGNVGLLAPGLGARGREVAVPVVEGHAHPAEEGEIARARRVGDHGHRGDRGEAEDPVRTVRADGVGVRGRDELGHLVPVGADEPPEPAPGGVRGALVRVLDDRRPGGDGGEGRARLAPEPEQPRAHERVLEPAARVEVPAIARPPRAAPRLVVGEVRARARVVGLLGLPGDDPALDVDLPRARARAVHPVGGTDDLVVLPALAVRVLPVAILRGGHPVAVREAPDVRRPEEVQPVDQVAHGSLRKRGRDIGAHGENGVRVGLVFLMPQTPEHQAAHADPVFAVDQ